MIKANVHVYHSSLVPHVNIVIMLPINSMVYIHHVFIVIHQQHVVVTVHVIHHKLLLVVHVNVQQHIIHHHVRVVHPIIIITQHVNIVTVHKLAADLHVAHVIHHLVIVFVIPNILNQVQPLTIATVANLTTMVSQIYLCLSVVAR
jgi:hypothetical protein